MTDLHESLIALATRGTPRGADAVFNAAAATERTAIGGDLIGPSRESTSVGSAIEMLRLNSSPVRDRSRSGIRMAAAFAVAAMIIAVAVVGLHQQTPRGPAAASPTTISSPVSIGGQVEVPGMTSSSRSEASADAAAFASLVAGALTQHFAALTVDESATRVTNEGQATQWAYLQDGDRRLFAEFGGPGLIDSVSGLRAALGTGPTSPIGTTLTWPDGVSYRTVAIENNTLTVIVRSEAIDATGTARPASDIVSMASEIITVLTANDATPPASPPATRPTTAQSTATVSSVAATMTPGERERSLARGVAWETAIADVYASVDWTMSGTDYSIDPTIASTASVQAMDRDTPVTVTLEGFEPSRYSNDPAWVENASGTGIPGSLVPEGTLFLPATSQTDAVAVVVSSLAIITVESKSQDSRNVESQQTLADVARKFAAALPSVLGRSPTILHASRDHQEDDIITSIITGAR